MPRRAAGPKPGPKPGPSAGRGGRMRRSRRRTVRRVRRRTRRRRILVGGATIFMIGGSYSSYKLSQQNAQQIEQSAGKNPEQMSEAEIENAMDEQGIQDLELTPEDEAAIEAEAV